MCNSFYEQYVDIVPRVRDVIMEAISELFVNVGILLFVMLVACSNACVTITIHFR